ncbi:MAG: hypothetical protein PHY80_05190 [Rickettsiales bacterium]|nr:hypothetical protein [Rickettsiales bacterium]
MGNACLAPNLITEKIYQQKKEELNKELVSIKTETELHDDGDEDFKKMLITAFYLASKSYELFICSKNEKNAI